MNRSAFVAILEILAVISSLVGTYLEFGAAPTCYVLTLWLLIFAYVLTVRRKRQPVR